VVLLVDRQLQQLFHLHEADALPAFAYAELSATTGAKGGRQFDCAVCLCEFADDDRLRLLPPWLASSAA
jgi:hypothetical protein